MLKKLLLAVLLALAPLTAAAQPSPPPGPWLLNGSAIYPKDAAYCLTLPGSVTGGCKGAGSANFDSLFIKGVAVPTTGGSVASFSGGATGLTPSSATTGAVVLGGTLAAASGGTGLPAYVIGDLLYASGTSALSRLADVATGNALISGGVGVAPAWGKIGLTTHVSGTLPVANGGTNSASPSGTALDNITGFSGTGFIKRTGAGTYTFTADPSDVTSVSNSDGTLTVSPTTGAVTASLALGHANTWTGQQTFVAPILGTPASGNGSNITNVNAAQLNGATFASPGAIGGTTPGTGAFTSLTSTGAHTAFSGTAPTSGGSASQCYFASSTSVYGYCWGIGAPTFSAAKGTLYLDNSGGVPYYNSSGSTTWTAIGAAGTIVSGTTALSGGTSTGVLSGDGSGHVVASAALPPSTTATTGSPGAGGVNVSTQAYADTSSSNAVAGGKVVFRCVFDGTAGSPTCLSGSYNVASITKNGTGDYTFTFTSAITDANYTIAGSAVGSTSGSYYTGIVSTGAANTVTTTTVRFLVYNWSTGSVDTNRVSVMGVR